MFIGGLEKFTLIDYPKKIACTVFTLGCNFRCQFCHNPELIMAKENSPRVSEREFFKFLKNRIGKLDGVCITGGEPAIQDDIIKFIKKIKKLGFLVKFDTNGIRPDIIKELVTEKLIDYIAMDIKAPLGLKSQTPNSKSQTNPKFQITKYEDVIGVKIDIEKIKESASVIMSSPIDYEFRTTAVPGIHTEENFIEIGKWLNGAKAYYIQEYREIKIFDEKLKNTTRGKTLDIDAIAGKLKEYFGKVGVRR